MLFREEDEDESPLPFLDRAEAGQILATRLTAYADRSDVVVLGLPRGGVRVAWEVAHVLKVPLDVLVVRKLGVPWDRELAMGAVASGGVQVLDLSLVKELDIAEEQIRETVAAELQELQRRENLYRGERAAPALDGKTVILVDDGIATGASILAAIAAVRRHGAARIVVAIPVAPPSACNSIRMEADDLVSVAEPSMFLAVSQWYESFDQVTDDDVRTLLEETASSLPRAA
jgi:putative phosphoribosyl transferase